MIILDNIWKSFTSPAIDVLKNIDIKINDGEFVSLIGKSGSGKSTLLYIISSLDTPSKGKVIVDGVDIATMNSKDLHEFRNQQIGFVFQFHYLLPELTALENVLLPARKSKRHHEKVARAKQLLEEFGLSDKINSYPHQLSGGQTQRIAMARALIMDPKYIFADEPTGSLDSKNSQIVIDILKKINKEQGATIIYVTHDTDFAAQADRQIQLIDGMVEA